VNNKTYYGSLTVGKDPLSPEGQSEFETTRQRDAEKRHLLYWCGGIIVVGYIIALVWTRIPSAKASVIVTETPTASLTDTLTLVPTGTPEPVQPTSMPTPTPKISLTYAPTATDRITYRPGPVQVVTVIVEQEVPYIITQIVTVEVTVVVTATSIDTPTPTETPSPTPSPIDSEAGEY
jgi:hypothetical protein